MKNFAQREPVLVASITGLVAAGIILAISFGAPITPDQADALNAFALAVLPIAFAVVRKFTRSAKESTANEDVVERAGNGVVLAGEANELPTDAEVRELGELDASV